MTQVVAYLLVVWQWVLANPWMTACIIYAVLNLAYAQLPKPKNPTLASIWEKVHWFLGLIVTHKDEIGTFSAPRILLWLVKYFGYRGEK